MYSIGELTFVFLAVFLAAWLLYRRHCKANDDQGRRMPPSIRSLPVVGSLPFLPIKLEDLAEFCFSSRNKLGKIFTFWAGSRRILMISGWEAIHEALVTKAVDFADRPRFYIDTLMNPNHKGVATVPYDAAFKSHRQLCLSILKQFGFGQRVMETRILMEVEEMIKAVRAEHGRPFDVQQLITSCVANVVMNMAFGRRFDHADAAFQKLISNVHEAMAKVSFPAEMFPLLRRLPYYRRRVAESADLFGAVNRFVDDNIKSCRQDEKATESFVSHFIEAHGPDYDREQLVFTMRDLAMAGMDTTATTLRWATALLTNHPAVTDRLHNEIDSVIGGQRLPTLDDRPRLPYVEATILEVMRIKSLAPFSLPHSTLQDTELSGYFIPRGTMVMVNLYSAHMDPADWHQPKQFRPERFLDESGSVIGRERVIPFSLGKRSCLGEQLARQELFLFLVAMLQNFHFRPPEGQESIEVHEVWGETNSPSPFQVRLIPRQLAN